MTIDPRIHEAIDEAIATLGVSVYDVEWAGAILRISLDRPGGIDLDTLSEASHRIGGALDLADVVPGSYQLEVASPGLERTLRTPEHWSSAVGEHVTVKVRPGVSVDRRIEGHVRSVGATDVTLAPLSPGGNGQSEVVVAFSDIERARTVFVWGPAPKPGHRGPGPSVRAQRSDGAQT